MTEVAEPARPALRIVSGRPTAEELAAVTAVLAAAASVPAEPEPVAEPSRWGRPQLRSGTWPSDLSPTRYGQTGPGGQW